MDILNSTITADYASLHFAEVLSRVRNGEAVTITQQGAPVAKVTTPDATETIDETTLAERRNAIEQLKAFAATNSLDGLKIRDLIEEGRR